MGFSDIGCYGSEIATPNLDNLATHGVRFTQMYNCARCCPTRASLLTGLYPHQAGIGHMMGDYGVPEYQGYLRDDCVTIAEVLKSAGYQTGLSGKWHVGGSYDLHSPESWKPGTPRHPIPTTRGFDRHFGTLEGAGSYFAPFTLMENDTFVKIGADQDFYYTDEISRHAVSMIDDFTLRDDPFFLYVAFTAPHWPLQARPAEILKYRGKYQKGWDLLRVRRYERLIELGIIDKHWKLSPRDSQSFPWEDCTNKDWEDARMAVYAAQIDSMDQGIGHILDALDRTGVRDNTIVVFLSDNGGCAELLAENGWVEQFVAPCRDGTPVVPGNDRSRIPGAEDTYMSYDLPWANASNTPFRYFKHWVHEGGIATPMIVSWPAGVAKQGSLNDSVLHVMDLMATFCDLSGTRYPSEFNGRAVTPLEGESFAVALSGHSVDRQRPIFWEHEGNCAVRDAQWKLVKRFEGDWELYDMSTDRTELADLSDKRNDLTRTLSRQYRAWAARCSVREWSSDGLPIL